MAGGGIDFCGDAVGVNVGILDGSEVVVGAVHHTIRTGKGHC